MTTITLTVVLLFTTGMAIHAYRQANDFDDLSTTTNRLIDEVATRNAYRNLDNILLDKVCRERHGVSFQTYCLQSAAASKVIDPKEFVRMQTLTGRWVNKLNTK